MSQEQPIFSFSDLLASTVHDMKNSLSTVMNHITELPVTTENQSQLSALSYEAKRLNNQLITLLSLYKIEKKQLYLNVDEYNVASLISDCIISHQELLNTKNISISVICDNDLVWYFDETLISGVLANIVTNAYRYTKDKILIEASIKNNMLWLSLSDNGPGYPNEMLSPENINSHTISFASGSTGLGLFFSQNIAYMHKNNGIHGYIQIDNQGIEHGGRFQLIIP